MKFDPCRSDKDRTIAMAALWAATAIAFPVFLYCLLTGRI